MSKLTIALFVMAGLGLAGCATQKDTYVTAARPAAPLVPITKDAYDAAIRNADARYKIDKDACSSRSGNAKDVCLKEADAALVKAKADARVDRVAADTSQDGAAKQAEARTEANTAKRDADYKVAIEKCDALAGSAKDSCVNTAKAQFGKS